VRAAPPVRVVRVEVLGGSLDSAEGIAESAAGAKAFHRADLKGPPAREIWLDVHLVENL